MFARRGSAGNLLVCAAACADIWQSENTLAERPGGETTLSPSSV
jgi:hypothetical protein